MAELDAITEDLRRQRRETDDLMEQTSTRRGETADLADKIEDLRRRSEENLRRFRSSAEESKGKPAK
jgi:predicted nuclease with TOPRIM domain